MTAFALINEDVANALKASQEDLTSTLKCNHDVLSTLETISSSEPASSAHTTLLADVAKVLKSVCPDIVPGSLRLSVLPVQYQVCLSVYRLSVCPLLLIC